jgi:hypothetical protein
MKWHKNHDDVSKLAKWLDDDCLYFRRTSEVVDLFTDPSSYEREWRAMHLWESIPEEAKDARSLVTIAVSERSPMGDKFKKEVEYLVDRDTGRPSSIGVSLVRLVLGRFAILDQDETS